VYRLQHLGADLASTHAGFACLPEHLVQDHAVHRLGALHGG